MIEKDFTQGNLSDPKLGAAYANAQIKYYAKPCSAFFVSFLGSFIIGCLGPCFGFFLVKCLVGLGKASYLDTSGLDEIKYFLIMMLCGSILALFGKTFQ